MLPVCSPSRPGVPRRRSSLATASLALLAVLAFPGAGRAEQPRDWMVAVQPNGHLLFVDVLFPGVQATYQYNRPVYGFANKLRLRANALLTIPFYESQADAEIRIVILTLGVGAGFRDVFRTLTFEAGDDFSRGARRGQDSRSNYTQSLWGFGEFRAELSLPINDYVVFHSRNAFRFEGRDPGTFDYRTGIVHDGRFFISDTWLYFKHPKLGAIAPTLEVISYESLGDPTVAVNVGGTLVTRAGLMVSNDLLYVQMLFNTAGDEGRNAVGATYGAHMLYGRFTLLLAYRAMFNLDEARWF